jgi:protein-S-isoprenylcysteine O-methyltransferase Ste14
MSSEQTSDTAGIRVFPPLVYLAGLIVGYLIWWFWPVSIVPAEWSFSLRVAAGVALLLGGWLIVAAASAFHRVGTDANPMVPTTALALDGPYRFTRNPMYLGMALLVGGFALLGNALWPLLALIPVIWFIRTQVIDREERYLEARFGVEYRDFTSRVRRWL